MRIDPPPCKDKAVYAAWGARHQWCQACGVPASLAEFPGLSTHHWIKQHRAFEGCVQLRLCHRCHQAAEGLTVKVRGAPWPKLTIGVCRTLKLVRESEEYNEARCRQLRGSAIPNFEPIPDVIELSYRSHRPWDRVRFFGGRQ